MVFRGSNIRNILYNLCSNDNKFNVILQKKMHTGNCAGYVMNKRLSEKYM